MDSSGVLVQRVLACTVKKVPIFSGCNSRPAKVAPVNCWERAAKRGALLVRPRDLIPCPPAVPWRQSPPGGPDERFNVKTGINNRVACRGRVIKMKLAITFLIPLAFGLALGSLQAADHSSTSTVPTLLATAEAAQPAPR